MAKAGNRAAAATAKSAIAPTITRGRILLAIAAVAVIAFVVYTPALRGPFLFDDLSMPYGQPGATTAPLRSFLGGVRPLLYSTFWIQTRIWGTDPAGYHVVNLLLHVLNGVLAGWVAYRILGSAGEAGMRRWILTGFAMGAFVLHPLQTEAVAYVASLSEVMSVFFFFCAVVLYMAVSSAGITWARALAVLVLWGLAMGTKEHVFVFPVFLAVTDYFWNPGQSWAGVKRNWRIYALFPAVAVAGLIFVKRALGDTATVGFNLPGITWWQYFLTECKAIWIYLRLFVLPFGQNVDYGFPVVKTLGDPLSWVGMAGLLAATAAAIARRNRYPLASYGFLSFLVVMAPTSSFLPIMDAVVERRLYLGFLPLLFIALEFLRRWKASTTLLTTAALAIVLGLACITFSRNHVYQSTVAMWEDSVAGNPRNDRAHFQLGYALYREGRCGEAVKSYERVASLRRPDYVLLVDWALALDCNGESDAAVAKIKEALALESSAHGLAAMGMIYGKAGRNEEALEALAKAEKANANFEMTYVYRGTVLYNLRRYSEAAAQFRKALALNPENSEARGKLAQAEAAGR